MKDGLKKIKDGLTKSRDRLLKVLKLFHANRHYPIVYALLVSLISLPIWYWMFEPKTPIESQWVDVQLSAPGSEIVKAYWDNPKIHPDAYNPITVKPVKSQKWNLTIEAIGEKNSDSDGFEVAILDIKTPQGQVDWTNGEFIGGTWEFRPDPNGPQGKVAIAHSNQPEYGIHPGQIQSLSMIVEGGDLEILLLSHTGSGKVRVTGNNRLRELDLYSYNIEHKSVIFVAGEVGDRIVRDYQFEIPKNHWRPKLKFISDGSAKVNIQEVKIGDTILISNRNNEYIIPNNRMFKTLLATLINFGYLAIAYNLVGQ